MEMDKKHTVAILGSGESGMGAVRLAVKKGITCMLSDFGAISDEDKNELVSLDVAFEENGHTLERLAEFDEIIKSPGIPNTAPVIQSLKEKGVPVISEIEFASRFTNAKLIGITGSNGKTTTTLLTTHLLKSSVLDAVSAGNVGNSLSNLLVEGDHEIIVIELSSFQLDDIKDFNVNVGVILNITPDHMDRYEHSMDKYADAKFRLTENMSPEDLFIYNTDDPVVRSRVKDIPARLQTISGHSKSTKGAYYDEGHLVLENDTDMQVLTTQELPLLGKHNHYNQMAAVLVAMEMGVSFTAIYQGLLTFKNAPHRMEIVDEIRKVVFINDSKATNVDSVYYALEALDQDIIWIAGGVNKGNDYSQIKSLVTQKVKGMVCLGKDNAHLIDEFEDVVDNHAEVTNAEMAVATAYLMADPGDTILLSPACASFDLFKNYEDRGDQFKAAVKELKEAEKIELAKA